MIGRLRFASAPKRADQVSRGAIGENDVTEIAEGVVVAYACQVEGGVGRAIGIQPGHARRGIAQSRVEAPQYPNLAVRRDADLCYPAGRLGLARF